MRQGLQQAARQEMQLQPRMLQAIEVLQLAMGELEPFLREAVLENEALRLEDRGAAEQGAPAGERWTADAGATDRHAAWLDSLTGEREGLDEHLLAQLGLSGADDEELPWVRFVIGALDASGHLTISDAELLEIAEEEGLAGGVDRLGRAIARVQAMEPRGIGGRDTVESLLLQLDPEEEGYALLCRLLEDFLDDIARNKLPAVARALGIDLTELSPLLERLRELDPAPGLALSGSSAPPIRPDVVVEFAEGRPERPILRVVHSGLPAVALDEDVLALARDPEQPVGIRRYLRDKVERGRWLLEAVEQRERTLLRVATWIFQRQTAFLEHGPRHVVPLTMTSAAEDLGLHVSTISRAVAGKYAETPWGIQSLRSLFPAAAVGQPAVARGGVQDALRRIIEAEDPEHPLSDDELVVRLRSAGFKVARRTAAKYRTELGIPSSYRRRRYPEAS